MVDAIKKKGNKKQVKFAEKVEKNADKVRDSRKSILPLTATLETNKKATAGITGLNRMIYDGGNRASLPGNLVRKEGDNPTTDEDVNNIYDRLGNTYDFFKNIHARNSLDGAGLPLISTVNYRKGYANAFWDGTQMVFGDGDGKLFVDMTGLSIVAHELTHGVVQYSGELDYHGQSGALNESCADIFGALVEQYTLGQSASEASWLVGEGLLGPSVNGVALRSLKTPGEAYDDPVLGTDPQPYHMDDYVRTRSDHGGVHINSGIPNHAFYLLSMLMGGNAWEKAGRIWYKTLQDNHNTKCNFKRWAKMTIKSARQIFGSGSLEEKYTEQAWKLVGLL
jgi:Zn-dependent metalloprotease